MQIDDDPSTHLVIAGEGAGGLILYQLQLYCHEVWRYDEKQALGNKNKSYDPSKVTVKSIGAPYNAIYGGGDFELVATHSITGDVHKYLGVPDQWEKIGGPGKTFVTAYDSTNKPRLYGLSPVMSGQEVYLYDGTPNNWTKIRGNSEMIYTGGTKLFATDLKQGTKFGNIFKYDGKPFQWTAIGDGGIDFVVGAADPTDPNPNLYRLNQDGTIDIWTGNPYKWNKFSAEPAKRIYPAGKELCFIHAVTDELYRQ